MSDITLEPTEWMEKVSPEDSKWLDKLDWFLKMLDKEDCKLDYKGYCELHAKWYKFVNSARIKNIYV